MESNDEIEETLPVHVIPSLYFLFLHNIIFRGYAVKLSTKLLFSFPKKQMVVRYPGAGGNDNFLSNTRIHKFKKHKNNLS